MYKPYGIIPPIITPFDEAGHIDLAALAKMAVHLVDNGVHGLFPFGTTGEFYAVGDEEYIAALKTVKEAVAGKTDRYGKPIQLLAGCSHITTREVVRLIKLVEGVGGYDAISVLTPMFVSQTQDELYDYFKTIADSTSMPILMYNNPPKTGVNITPATAARLAHDCPNIIGVKDSSGDMTNCEEYLRLTMDVRDKFNVMMGRDTIIYAALHYGATGAVASCANVAPRITADIYDCYVAGDYEGALAAQYKLAPLRIATNMGTFPAAIKEGLVQQGIPVGKCLEPIAEMKPEQKAALRKVLVGMGLVKE
ncbi:MAG: dihydrodipicolinate synthase family protein [Faecalibacterium sp.]|nr:dihydrodipicolinate synthase family protein [Clostridia bacterium]MBQ7859171.1 dihydrodipicolinate synthase family protein [Faecalibacterium sp.]